VKLRDYQQAALDGARAQFRAGKRAVLIVLPTGTGKTVIFAEAIRLACEKGGKALVLAHRTELLEQARAKLHAVAPDLRVELEQAALRASSRADVVVASVQSLRGARLERWASDAFRLIIVDEAHHATARTYRAILDHFAEVSVLGVTATPDRADERRLGEVFTALGYELSMQRAIADGYLVPLKLRTVQVEALDMRHVKSRAGDFVEADLVAALEGDDVLLEIAGPLPDLAGARPTIVFIAGVKNAYRLAELLNTRTGRPGCAVALDGTSDPAVRAHVLALFKRAAFQFLINVGLFTEGFDAPQIACVAVARPTQSRGLYCQMLGRGTRPLAGVIDAHDTDAARGAAIVTSAKPDLLVVDFTTSTAQHRLVTPLDVLGVGDPAVQARALELLEEDPELDLTEATERAARDEHLLATKRLAERYELTVEEWDPFRLIAHDLSFEGALELDLRAVADPAHADESVRVAIVDLGVAKDVAKQLTLGQCVAVQRAIAARLRRGLCSLKQARQLSRYGLNPNVSKALGGHAMRVLVFHRWPAHCPAQLARDPRFALPRAESAA
jgi:superfamily II DNA or RNA helicase